MKVAVASSGLGHVARGIETWAADTAAALAARSVDVTLFAGAVVPGDSKAVAGADGLGPRPSVAPTEAGHGVCILHCLRRSDPRAKRLAAHAPGFAWRWGLKSDYGWEQLSFWWTLWPKLRRGRYDVLHVQDPLVAFWCRKFRRLGLLRTREILAHGTEEPAKWLKQFSNLQHLAPWHLEQALSSTGARKRPLWVAIPNFVDTDVYSPATAERKRQARRDFGVPEDAFLVGTVATVKRPHKRVDHLIREFAALVENGGRRGGQSAGRTPHLLIAGARTPQSDELQRLAEQLIPGQTTFCYDLPRAKMPMFYNALDVFTLVSLFEMMPIAVLEALASGVPVVCNNTPVLAWMIGEDAGHQLPGGAGGVCVDMARDGGLAELLADIDGEWINTRGRSARARAVEVFSTNAVIGEYIDYYKRVCASG